MATIAQLIVDVAANTVKLTSDVENINKSLSSVETMAGRVGKALAATFTIAAAGQAARELLDYADNVVNVAEKTKFSTDAVQELTMAFQPHGIAIDAVSSANEKLSKNLIGGDKSTVAALEKMGLNIKTLKTLAPDQLFITVADAVGKIQNPAEQAYVAMTVFGKGGSELLAGLDGHLKETTESFKSMGLVIDEQTIKAADDFGDQLGLLGKQFLGIIAAIVGPFLPALSAFGTLSMWIGDILKTVLIVAIKGLEAAFGLIMEKTARLLAWMADLATKIPLVGKQLGFMGDASRTLTAFADGTSDALKHLFDKTNDVGASAPKAGGALKGFGGDIDEAARKAKEFKEALEKYNAVGTSYIATVDQMSGKTVDGIRYDLARGQSQEVLQKIYGVTADQIKAVIEVTNIWKTIDENRATVAKAAAEVFVKRMADQVVALHDWQDAYLGNMQIEKSLETEHADSVRKQSLNTFQYQRAQLADWINDQEGELDYSKENWSAAYEQIHLVAHDRLQAIVSDEQQAFVDMKAQEATWSNGFSSLLGGIPDLLQKAFTGGGGMSGFGKAITSGLGSLVGGQLITGPLTSMFNNAAPALLNTFGSTLTGVIGGAIPFIGPAIGALAGPLLDGLKKLFGGPSADELAARDTFAKFQKNYGSLAQTIEGVGAAYAKMGKTGTEAQADLQAALNATHISAEAEAAALDVINGKLNQGAQDQADLQAAVDRYKFSIEELGPAMQAQQLDAQAQQLTKDWTLLIGSGMNMAVVNEHMSGAMNDYLQQAVKTGQDVPMAMQPIIQSMIDQGLFLDSNGSKITDIKDLGVTFSMTMTEGFKLVADKLQTLLEKLGLVPSAMDDMKGSGVDAANAVADAINKIPKVHETVFTVVGGTPATGTAVGAAVTETASNLDRWYAQPDSVRMGTTFDEWIKTHAAAMGGLVTANGIQHFAGGGVVLPFQPRGIDTVPLMAAPGEGMVNRTGMGLLGVDGLNTLNAGRDPRRGGTVIDFGAMAEEMRATRKVNERIAQSQERLERYLRTESAKDNARATRDALQKVVSR